MALASTGICQQKYFRIYTTRDGLPSSTIPACPEAKTVFQDSDGFIWLATFGGVSIYDGHKFLNHTVENGGINDDNVLNFFQRSRDEIWVVESACTDVFVKRKLVRSIPIRGYGSSYYLNTHNGKILTARDGYIYEIRDYQPYAIASFPYPVSRMFEAGRYFLIEDRLHDSLFLVDHAFQSIRARLKGRVFIDRYQRVWCFNAQFYLLDTVALQRGLFQRLPPPPPVSNINVAGKQVLDFLPDRDGYYWVLLAGEKGVLRIDPEGSARFFHIITNNFISLLEDHDGNIWIPGDAGFYKYYNKYNDFYSEEEGLPSEYITGIAVDQKSGIWLANRNGFSCIYQGRVYNFAYANGPSVWSTLTTRGDSLWVINNGVFLYKISYGQRPVVRLVNTWQPLWSSDDFVDYITLSEGSHTGAFFLNKYSYGLFYVKADGAFQKIHEAGLTTFFVDGNELWTAGPWQGVARWKVIPLKDSVQLHLLQRYTQVPDNFIRSITKDRQGNLWMGCIYKGILKFEKQYDTFLIRNYNARQGLKNPWVLKVSAGLDGGIFAGTMAGIFQIHPKGPSAGIEDLSTRFGDVYTTWDFVRDAKGDFWLATPMGVIHVLNHVYRKSPPPRVFFTQMLKNNHPDSSIFYRTSSRFPYDERNLAFEFSATSFRNEEKVLYSYTLEKRGDTATWSLPQPIHTVSLVSLSPGAYTLKVKAVTAENVWSETPAVYNFVIRPPFWSAWWFRVMLLLVTAAVLVTVYKFRIRQLRKVMALRFNISRDLHDEIGSTLSGIGLISEMAKEQLQTEKAIEVKKSLNKISSISEEMLGKMSDIVWAINPQNDSFEKMISRLRTYANTIAAPHGVQLHFEVAGDLVFNLDMQRRNNVYLICKEAINNAIKYSGCRNLYFELKQVDHQMAIRIWDDGKGFNPRQAYDGNGLKNMHARAQEIKAHLEIASASQRGTAVNLSVKFT